MHLTIFSSPFMLNPHPSNSSKTQKVPVMRTCPDKAFVAVFSSVVLLLLLGCLLASSQGSEADVNVMKVYGSRRMLVSSTNLYRSTIGKINEAVEYAHGSMKTSFRKAPPSMSNPSQNSQPQP